MRPNSAFAALGLTNNATSLPSVLVKHSSSIHDLSLPTSPQYLPTDFAETLDEYSPELLRRVARYSCKDFTEYLLGTVLRACMLLHTAYMTSLVWLRYVASLPIATIVTQLAISLCLFLATSSFYLLLFSGLLRGSTDRLNEFE